METKHSQGLFKDLFKHIKEEKDARMAFFYSLFYFVFITVLLIFGFKSPAQTATPFHHEAKVVKLNSPPDGEQSALKKKAW